MTNWIPCSEKMPTIPGPYLVTTTLYGKPEIITDSWVKMMDGSCRWDFSGFNEVTAWAESPEPYGGRSTMRAHLDERSTGYYSKECT